MPATRPELPDAQAFQKLSGPACLPCLVQGQGAPLLLIHGSLCDARYWMPQLPALSQTWRCIAPSLRHYYPETASAATGWPTLDWRRDVDDLATLINTLPERRAHVVAHSRGGFIACQLALHYPELIDRLVLAEPGGSLPGDPVDHQAQRRAELSDLLAAGDMEAAAARFVDGVSQPGAWRFSPASFRQMALANAHTLPGQMDDPLPVYEERAIRRLGLPVLLIHGQRSRARFKAVVQTLSAWMSDARMAEIAGAAHGMNLAHPRAFNEAVLAFLGEIRDTVRAPHALAESACKPQ